MALRTRTSPRFVTINSKLPNELLTMVFEFLPFDDLKKVLLVCRLAACFVLSSPRAKHAGPKGLRAESARDVTGRQCPHSGEGEDFVMRQPSFFFYKTAITGNKNS